MREDGEGGQDRMKMESLRERDCSSGRDHVCTCIWTPPTPAPSSLDACPDVATGAVLSSLIKNPRLLLAAETQESSAVIRLDCLSALL